MRTDSNTLPLSTVPGVKRTRILARRNQDSIAIRGSQESCSIGDIGDEEVGISDCCEARDFLLYEMVESQEAAVLHTAMYENTPTLVDTLYV